MVRIIGINGSPFEDGYAARLVRAALDAASSTGADTRFIQLDHVRFPHHDGRRPEEASLEDRTGELLPDRGGLREVLAEIMGADGVIFGTSTNCFSAHACMLSLFAWLQTNLDAPEYPLAGKVAAFMSVCEEDGAQNANMALAGPAIHLGFCVPPFCTFFRNKLVASSEGEWQDTDVALVGLNVRRQCQLNRGELHVFPITSEMWNDHRVGSW